ncbi:prolipoprotein diacylglyceryl transferase [Cryptosporangium aurantiacum]|uniref:Phosphatidylglycerol--prolipoprotein diacylglyceryl transferase n=1 Tax=Cryptosporangium aurantiacum TaxID=134849 RepID=A0A1M7IA24_9ACTN|nr:prolipoprotein diacylglyceryl transferase [Cryptosporangium aurantiacum]SHM37594.1 prolipoprotein diacylglyceryl transferase [Cryptosporangium aurantiacum]
MTLASLPSPTTSVWHVGPLPLRAYALCILAGVLVAVWVSDRRLRARGGPPGLIVDVAVWAVPFGIVGARIYHVITSPDRYFGADGDLTNAFKIWEGGLGVWGSIAGGAVGAWIACRRAGLPLRILADVVAPGIVLAQAVGRLGNWFNNELYGRETDLPWGLRVHAMGSDGRSLGELPGTYHPTFLYEALWCIGVAVVLIVAERKWRLGRGRVFALYVMGYTLGRAWIEHLRIDEAQIIFGLRLNEWTALVCFIGALIWFVTHRGAPELLAVEEDGRLRVLDPDAPEPDPAGGDEDGAAPMASAEETETDRKPQGDEPADEAEASAERAEGADSASGKRD